MSEKSFTTLLRHTFHWRKINFADMVPQGIADFLSVALDKDLSEVGGGHNTKGIEFQRCWALIRLFELENEGANDYLILFESVQDIAIMDSATMPNSIKIYQVKKKDRKEWGWSDLTALSIPEDPSKPSKAAKKSKKLITDIKHSPLGKLYGAIHAFKDLESSGAFISNAGCDLPLASGANAATSVATKLIELPSHYLDLITRGLETFHQPGESAPDLSKIYVEKVALSVDDPHNHVVGVAFDFLSKRSPQHAAQAKSLVEALLAKLGPLGARTATCKTFDDIVSRHGYSKANFVEDISQLQEVPDICSVLDNWLNILVAEGMGVMDVTGLRIASTKIFRNQLGGYSPLDQDLVKKCDEWLLGKPDPVKLFPYFEEAYMELKNHTTLPKPQVMAHFALRAILKCINPS